jgi:hypothetical protein
MGWQRNAAPDHSLAIHSLARTSDVVDSPDGVFLIMREKGSTADDGWLPET